MRENNLHIRGLTCDFNKMKLHADALSYIIVIITTVTAIAITVIIIVTFQHINIMTHFHYYSRYYMHHGKWLLVLKKRF